MRSAALQILMNLPNFLPLTLSVTLLSGENGPAMAIGVSHLKCLMLSGNLKKLFRSRQLKYSTDFILLLKASLIWVVVFLHHFSKIREDDIRFVIKICVKSEKMGNPKFITVHQTATVVV